MAHPDSYRPEPGSIPVEPGVYRFWDVDGRVIYVGKAKNLRSRLSSYFVDSRNHHQRTTSMVRTAARVDWVVVANEVEALQLEYSWIKAYEPRFNVKYTDDKSYPYLAVTVGEEFPRITVLRGERRKGVRYFGPYSHAWAIRETVDQLLRVFPARTCSKGVFRRANISGRPCLLAYIGKCSAPCVGRVTPEQHRQVIDDFCSFVGGNTNKHIRSLKAEMQVAAESEDFETAARIRDDVFALEKAMAKNAVVFNDETDADVVALAEDELQAAVQVFHVRSGRVVGQRGFVVDRVIPVSGAELIEQILLQLYGEESQGSIPKEVLVSHLPPLRSDMADWLASRRGSRVDLRKPQRGDKKDLMVTVARNADQSLAAHKRKRIGDLTTRGQALEALQKSLDLVSAPLRIEGYDISTLAGTDTVGSMVVFEDGLSRSGDYRRFTVTLANAGNDLAALSEVLTRRFKRYLTERIDASDFELAVSEAGGRGRKSFQYPPQLVMVDGGAPQVAAARAALDELGMDDIPVCGLAKRLEEIYLPGQEQPIILSRASPALLLLQQVRDESHRFAIAGHRKKRSARAKGSALDAVPGLGPAKRKALLRHFRTAKAVQAASPLELQEVAGIGPNMAATISCFFADGGAPANQVVNLTTGEVLDG